MDSPCIKCEKRESCTEICAEVEALLPKINSGKLPSEISVDPMKMDRTFSKVLTCDE